LATVPAEGKEPSPQSIVTSYWPGVPAGSAENRATATSTSGRAATAASGGATTIVGGGTTSKAKWLSRSAAVTGGPPPGGGVPETRAVLVYGPGVATRVAVKVHVSVVSSRPSPSASPPTNVGRTSSAGSAGVPASSTTATPESGTLPGLVTRNVKVTVLPVVTIAPGAVLLSVPLVCLTRAMAGARRNGCRGWCR
jgi:hypothetical protein